MRVFVHETHLSPFRASILASRKTPTPPRALVRNHSEYEARAQTAVAKPARSDKQEANPATADTIGVVGVTRTISGTSPRPRFLPRNIVRAPSLMQVALCKNPRNSRTFEATSPHHHPPSRRIALAFLRPGIFARKRCWWWGGELHSILIPIDPSSWQCKIGNNTMGISIQCRASFSLQRIPIDRSAHISTSCQLVPFLVLLAGLPGTKKK